MPMRIANTYAPASPLGYGMQMATRALFSEATPNEIRAQDREDMLARSTVALQRAQADNWDLKRKLAEQVYRARSPAGVKSYLRGQAPEAGDDYIDALYRYFTEGGPNPGLPTQAMPPAPVPTPAGPPPPLTSGAQAAPPPLYAPPAARPEIDVLAAPAPDLPMGETLGGMREIPQGTDVPRETYPWSWTLDGSEPAPTNEPPWRTVASTDPRAGLLRAPQENLDAFGRPIGRPPAGMTAGTYHSPIGDPGPPGFGSRIPDPDPFANGPVRAPSVDVTSTIPGQGGAAPAPAAATGPAALELLRRIAAAYATMQSVNMGDENVNPHDISRAFSENVAVGPRSDILYGRTSPEVGGARMAAIEAKPIYNNAPYGTYSQFSGQMGSEYGPGREKDLAAAERDRRHGQLYGEQINTEKQKQGYYSRMPQARAGGGGRGAKDPTKMTGVQMKRVDNALSAIMYGEMERAGIADPEEQAATSIDPATVNAIKSRAHELLTNPEGEFWDDAEGAVEQAVMEIAPQGFEDAGETDPGLFGWRNWLGVEQPRISHTMRPKGGGGAPTGTAGREAQPASPAGSFKAKNGRVVTWDEIVQTAKNRRMSPDDVIKQLQLVPGG